MIEINRSLEIAASPERVWQVLSHANEYDLQGGETREQVTSAQEEGVGVTLRVERKVGPLKLTLEGRMTEWQVARRMASEWNSGFPFFISTSVDMSLILNGAGTRLLRVYGFRIGLPFIGALGERWLSPNTARDMDNLMQRIKQASESQALPRA
jgi:carbon monoxide dehydrogenase subunit G